MSTEPQSYCYKLLPWLCCGFLPQLQLWSPGPKLGAAELLVAWRSGSVSHWERRTGAVLLALPGVSRVTLGKSANLSGHRLPPPQRENGCNSLNPGPASRERLLKNRELFSSGALRYRALFSTYDLACSLNLRFGTELVGAGEAYRFLVASVTSYRKLGDLEQQTCTSSQFWRPEV